ncbi:insulinoma-associated protein 2 [Thalassophryne amazonica]|uniref:insulinoma-associated protein 2 n=1 Tax=Thalassophryne amazonica TaxID=390379 RepID=UPI001471A134|nr:insulinoma-associated protein 2 [Thalassophryne amazonica]
MPRGFLVKRTRRCSVSYRSRTQTSDVTVIPSDPGAVPESSCVTDPWSSHVESALEAEAERRAQLPDTEEQVDVWTPDDEFSSCFCPPHLAESCSPVTPVGTRLLELHEEADKQWLTSSTVPEVPEQSFLRTSCHASMDRILATSSHQHAPAPGHSDKYDVHGIPPLTLMSSEHVDIKRSFFDPDQRLSSKPAVGKKLKANRKLHFEDDVTTSPVLGLRIKKESPELRRRHRDNPSVPSGNQPLGEFICQLCKEEYPDPFSLAQHRCSRIVRVEYRCPECDKVFSCPANLASHRRWHKPRAVSAHEEGKENELLRVHANQHHGVPDNSGVRLHSPEVLAPPRYRSPADLQQHARAADSPPASLLLLNEHEQQPSADEDVHECRLCGKKFRRQAYLRKHLAVHELGARASPPPASYGQARDTSGAHVFLCHLCGARFPSVEIRDKHRLWHAMRDELLAGTLGGGFRPELLSGTAEREQQNFTCKHCPSTFFSSPGLSRHISKSHPAQNRQVMLLHVPARP